MSTTTAGTIYTPNDLLAMPDDILYELVDGRLVERGMGAKSSFIGGVLYYLINSFNKEHRLGWVWPADCGVQCFPGSPRTVRRPDATFIRFGRLPGEEMPDGFITIAPDLVVEVLSPNDEHYETETKLEQYLAAGVQLIWVVNPVSRSVLLYRADGSIEGVREPGELSGEGVLPGFRCRVAEIFEAPTPDER